jgi:hypothetical protein
MAGLTQARQQAILDGEFVAGDFIAYSANGTSETASLARTAVAAWTSATAASPSVKTNSGALTSAGATAGVTVTHYAIYSASTAGTQKTDWTTLAASKVLAINDTVSWAIGALTVSLD